MRFEWDSEKDRINQRKHGGIAFESAALVFDDPHVIFYKDRIVDGDERWHAIGAAEGAMLLVVIRRLTLAFSTAPGREASASRFDGGDVSELTLCAYAASSGFNPALLSISTSAWAFNQSRPTLLSLSAMRTFMVYSLLLLGAGEITPSP